jgi:hypothetical protein
MKLRDLTDDVKEAFRKSKMLLGHAFQLARLREEEQKKTLQWMLSRGQDESLPRLSVPDRQPTPALRGCPGRLDV